MMYSQRRTAGGNKRKRAIRLLAVGLGIAAVVGAVAAVLDATNVLPLGIEPRDTELVALWNEARYDEVIRTAAGILEENPLDGEALTFSGFAHFYAGVELVQRAEQLDYLDRSIVMLRKALHVPRAPLAAERDYVLAKAYYHKGDEYVDLSVRYMERSLEKGFDAVDSRTYLGLGYARLGVHDESAAWLERAIERAPADEVDAVRMKAAEAYVSLGDYESARERLTEAIASLDDEFLVLMARNQLASVLILDGRHAEAETVLDRTIQQFPQSADAYYYLGVVYDQTDRDVQARDLWRTAREIDPNHPEALQRLANWGG
jgi:tetratricopeptide (TPR) repeat protein